MFKKLLILLCLTPALMLISCSDDDNPESPPTQITGSGDPASELRTLPEFHAVTLSTVGTVWVSVGQAQSVRIQVDDNVMDYIITTVVNGELFITSDPSVSLSDFDLYVTLATTDLEGLTLTGVGTMESEGNILDLDSFYVNLSGVGNINVRLLADYMRSTLSGVGDVSVEGSVNFHRIIHSAVGTITAYECSTDTTVAVLSGIGNAQVFVNDYLNVTIGGRGSLYYMGMPDITSVITGTGQLIDANPSTQ